MTEKMFRDELAQHIGSDVEVSTTSVLVEGILKDVQKDLVTVIELVEDGSTTKNELEIEEINFVRLL